jgi:hypothetical protein
VGTSSVSALAVSGTFMTLAVPAHADGVQNISVTDSVGGGSTTMTGALTYGAAVTDNIVLLNGANPSTPVGVQAANPVSVRVVASDGVTPVSGATVGWSGTNGVQFSACGGISACTVITDQNGNAASWITAAAAGTAIVTATLAPGVYSPSKSVNAALSATQSSSDIGVSTPYMYVSQGATVSAPVTARVLSNGVPHSNVQVNFTIASGTGSLSAGSAATNTSGYATVTLSLANLNVLAQVSACVAPGNSPCAVFYANPVPLAQQVLQQVSGAGQISTGQSFQPLVVRVVDSAAAPHPVLAAPVSFLTTVLRPGGMVPGVGSGDTNPGNPAMPLILRVTQYNTTTDSNGLASIVAAGGGFSPPVEVDVAVSAGSSAFLDDALLVFPVPAIQGAASGTGPPPVTRPISILNQFGGGSR